MGGAAAAWLYELLMAANATPQKLAAFFKPGYEDKKFDSEGEVTVAVSHPYVNNGFHNDSITSVAKFDVVVDY